MFEVSPGGANLWFDISNIVLFAGAVLVAMGTYGTIKFSGIKEKFADERISANEAETKRAIAESDKANAALGIAQAGIASANAAAEKARLETEKVRSQIAWRRLTKEQYDTLVRSLRGKAFDVWTSWVGIDPEATVFRSDIDRALTDAGLKTKYFSGWERSVGLQITHVPGPDFDALVAAFKAANLPVDVVPVPAQNPFGPTPAVAIIVGTKPPPF